MGVGVRFRMCAAAVAVWALASSGHAQRSTAERVLTIPVAGTVGMEITAKGFAEALRKAERQKVSKVVLEIDSPGGYLYEAEALLGVLEEHGEAFEIVAVVDEQALSAACVFLAGADRWLVSDSAVVGSATAFSADTSTGSVDVDAKLNAAWSAKLAARADANGWPGDLFRAMVERGVVLYAGWGDEGAEDESLGERGPARFSRSWPDNAATVERLDTAETVLALNGGELAALGLGTVIEEPDLEAVARVMGWGDVRTAGTYGKTSMVRAARTRVKLHEDAQEAWKRLDWHLQRGTESDPRGLRVYFDRDTMLLTGASQRAWSQAASESLGHWNEAEELLRRLAKIDDRAEREGAQHLRVDHERADEVYRRVSENVEFLRRNLRRTHYQLDP
jgi:hypothetical protein